MRLALLAFTILLATQTARAATAYEALRILGKQKSESLLDNITEVRGEHGAPEPRVWKIIVKDAARGGGREFSVQGNKLIGERSANAEGAPMNMSQLNLDSDGAHTVAEREAKKVAFTYDHANYTLRAGSKGGSPVWEVRLTDEQGGGTASLHIAATNGNVLSSDGLVKRRKPVVVAPPPAPEPVPVPVPAPRPQPAPEERPARPVKNLFGLDLQRANEEADKFFDRVDNHMKRRGRQIGDAFHNFFTGDHRDTAGPHHPPSETGPAPGPQRAGDEDYVRPSRVGE